MGWGWGPPLNAQQSVKAHGPTPSTRPQPTCGLDPDLDSDPKPAPNQSPGQSHGNQNDNDQPTYQSLNKLRSLNSGLASSLNTCGSAW